MEQTATDTPDLAGAEVFVEAAAHPIAGGRWYVLQSQDGATDNDRVIYQRPNGAYEHKSVIAARTLRTSPTWRRLGEESAAAD